MSGRKSAPVLGGFKSYYNESEKLDSSIMHSPDFFTFSTLPSPPPLRRADRDQCVVRRAASTGNVAFNIMHTSVMGSPIMDELRRQGEKRCYDRSALLGYSSYDSDNDSGDSVKRLTCVLGCSHNFHFLQNMR